MKMYGLRRPQRADRVVADRADRRLDDRWRSRRRRSRRGTAPVPASCGRRVRSNSTPAGQDRVQTGEDRRQPEPVERDPDELLGSAARVGRAPVGPRPGSLESTAVRPSASRSADARRLRTPPPHPTPLGRAAPRRSSATVDRSRTSRRSVAAGRHEPEEGPVERVDPGRGHPDPAEAEGEHRVLAVAGVVVGRAVGGSARARLAWPPNASWSAASRWATGSLGCQASSSQRAPTSVSARPWIRPWRR